MLIFWWRQLCPSPRCLPLFCNYQIGVTVLRLRNFDKIMLLVNVSWTRSTILSQIFSSTELFFVLVLCFFFFLFSKKNIIKLPFHGRYETRIYQFVVQKKSFFSPTHQKQHSPPCRNNFNVREN